MANDTDIKIGLQTVGGDAAVDKIEEVKDALNEVNDSADQGGGSFEDVFGGMPDALDDITEKAPEAVKSVGKLDDAIKEVGQHIASSKGFGREFAAAGQVVSGSAIAVVGSVLAIGAAAVKSYQMLDDTVARYRELQSEMKASGDGLGAELEAEIEKLEAGLGPLKTVVDGVAGAVGGFFKILKDPVGEISGINDLTAAWERQKEMMEKLKKARLDYALENQGDLARNYNFELQALKQQEETLQRIAKLRGDMSNLANEAAQQEVESARLRGGDVPLAQANALATKLQGELEALQNNLTMSLANAETALSQHSAAIRAYEQAKEDSMLELNPEEFNKIGVAVDNAKKALDAANQTVIDQQQTFDAGKRNILQGAENELLKLEREIPEEISRNTQKALDGIYNTIREQSATLGSSTGEVAAALSRDREQTVRNIQQLAPQPQDTAKVTGAVQELSKGIAAKDDVIVSIVAQALAVVTASMARFEGQQAQINQLAARLR